MLVGAKLLAEICIIIIELEEGHGMQLMSVADLTKPPTVVCTGRAPLSRCGTGGYGISANIKVILAYHGLCR